MLKNVQAFKSTRIYDVTKDTTTLSDSISNHISQPPSLQEVDLVCRLELRFSQPHCLHQHRPVKAHQRCGYPVLVTRDAEAIGQTMPVCAAIGIALVDVKQILSAQHGSTWQWMKTANTCKHASKPTSHDFTILLAGELYCT